MNQTEFAVLRSEPENKSTENIQQSLISGQSSKVTVLKGNSYEYVRDRTSKIQIPSKGGSRLIRVSSARGINVISTRPSSSEKQPAKQFQAGNLMSVGGSETTIKLDDSGVNARMKQQLKKAIQKYEDKMNQQLSYQHNYLTAQIDRLKQIITQNQSRLAKQQSQLTQLYSRVQSVQKKLQTKTTLMHKQLLQFEQFYQQCQTYTHNRILDAENNLQALIAHVQANTDTVPGLQAWQYVEYVNGMVKNIVARTRDEVYQLRGYLDGEIFELEVRMGGFVDMYERAEGLVLEMKEVKFSNEVLADCLRGYQGSRAGGRDTQAGVDLMDYYEPKLRDMQKKINSTMMEVELFKETMKIQAQDKHKVRQNESAKVSQLTKIIDTLNKKLEEDKSWYLQQLAQREQQLNRSNPRILELQSKLHAYFEQQAALVKQISQLKLKVSYYQTKSEKSSDREYGIQSTMAQAFAESIVKERVRKYDEMIAQKERKIADLEKKIESLDHENYLLAEKLTKFQDNTKEVVKLEVELKFSNKIIQEHEANLKKMFEDNQKLRALKAEVEAQLVEEKTKMAVVEALLVEEKTKVTALEGKINAMVQEKTMVEKQDDEYFQELEAEVEKCHQEIEKLTKLNQQASCRSQQTDHMMELLRQKNKQLEQDLHIYAETFQKQSINFRNALQTLQKQKDALGQETKQLKQQNTSLKSSLEHSKTAMSFYQNDSCTSIKLRKTTSTQFPDSKHSLKKLQRRSLSSKFKQDKITQLRNLFIKSNCPLPVLCQIDGTGYLKDQQTGCYFLDEEQNCFELLADELAAAVEEGLLRL